MTVIGNTLVTLIIKPAVWLRMAINRVTIVPSNGFFATVISNALAGLVDGVPVDTIGFFFFVP